MPSRKFLGMVVLMPLSYLGGEGHANVPGDFEALQTSHANYKAGLWSLEKGGEKKRKEKK